MKREYDSILKKHINELFIILDKYNVSDFQSFITTSESDMIFQKAVLMNVGYIGELSKKIDYDFKAKHPDIHWRRLGKSRNIIFHDYDIVDMRIIATVVYKDIQRLQSILNQ
jgi:uncharacterized protein with HEPN domain